jgi:alanine dehydrogenase
MSEVAGRLSVQAGGLCIQKHMGGSGILLGGVPGVAPAKITIIGGGVSGYNAAVMAVGSGAEVTVFERSLERIRHLDDIFHGRAKILYSTQAGLHEEIINSDIVIGAVLIPGAAAPKLIDRKLLKEMRNHSAFVDIAIDQGGCAETSRPTTHDDPIFVEEGVTHYCVANMPGAVARTSTFALGNSTMPYVLALANKGAKQAIADDRLLKDGLNVHQGKITHMAVSEALGRDYVSAEEALGIS